LVGYLSNSDPPLGPASPGIAWFLDGMSRLGYVEGQNYARISRYSGAGHQERLPALAEELVEQKPDVIFATATGCVVAAKHATSVIPIVGAHMIDPVGFGLAASEARPGGNVTGMLEEPRGFANKQLEFALEVVPGAASVGLLHHVTNPGGAHDRTELQKSAAARGLKCVVGEVHSDNDLDEAIAGMVRQGIDALIVISSTLFFLKKDRIAALALAARLPTFFGFREAAEAGALVGTVSILRHAFAAPPSS
jgi:putative tryptophan/tyrosine transport system substrate-binding protein